MPLLTCRQPRVLTYNQYLDVLHPVVPEANLLSFKVFLMTQVRAAGVDTAVRTRRAARQLAIS
jgi:hypothetical protein